MNSKNYSYSGAVNVQAITLTSLDGSRTYDLRAQVASFSIYEDITFPIICGEFLVSDAIDLLTTFPIIGEELITVSFSNPGFDLVNTYTLQIQTIENQIYDIGLKYKTYTIRAYSPEFFTSSKSLLNKKFVGNTDAVVSSIISQNLNTTKKIAVEPTKGIQDVLISRQHPLQAIDLFRTRAVSQKYLSSSYVFFENKRGFNFATIEFLQDQLQTNINDKVFFYDPAIQSDARNMKTRSIISFQQLKGVDNAEKIVNGGLNNIVKRFDLLTGQVSNTHYINSEQQQKFKYGTKNPVGLNTTQFETSFGSNTAMTLFIPHSSALPENYIDTALGPRHSYISKLEQNIFHVVVFGDVALTAGDIITINVPSSVGSTGTPTNNRLISGNYMISRLRHFVLNNSSGECIYKVAMELIKGFYEDNA